MRTPTEWRNERIRSYLRGRLGRIINPLAGPGGIYICHAKRPGLSFGSPELDNQFTGTLEQIAEHFGVTVPADIIEGS